ncbi:MAG: AAA family ATPase, partial [Candidatus Terrybacteria bacterium]|nr:AAA family ATPase [Candidatus Terrybacteria bacterium]
VRNLCGDFEQKYRALGVPVHIQVERGKLSVLLIDPAQPNQGIDPEDWIAQGRDPGEQAARRTAINALNEDMGNLFVQARAAAGRVQRAAGRHKRAAVRRLLFAHFGPRFRDFPEAKEYLTGIQYFVTQSLDPLLYFASRNDEETPRELMLPFQVNVVVDRAAENGEPPVINELNVTFPRLFGEITGEHRGNVVVTDHTKISGGALLEASGGVLVLDALKIFTSPALWPKLIATLEAGELKIGDFHQYAGMPISFPIEPDPVSIDTKVVLVFSDWLYNEALRIPPIAEKLQKLFRVKAEFVGKTKRTPAVERQYAEFLAMCAEREGLLPFSAGAVAKFIEHGSRTADHQGEISLQLSETKTLALEANRVAQTRLTGFRTLEADRDDFVDLGGDRVVTADDVRGAMRERELRVSRVREMFYDNFRNGTFLFKPTREEVARVYGLAVYSTGEIRFGIPMAITALNWAKPDGGVVSIDRKAELGGPILGKATDIIAAWLMARYAKDKPFRRGVTIVFEQSYGAEGDSASIAEVTAVLSSLSGLPIRQNLAVTGSMNQLGEVQPIGGVNEKVEGFYDVCVATHGIENKGVVIPAPNAQHLMVREDVVEACGNGKFSVYAVSRIEEAVEILFGLPIGEVDKRIRAALNSRKRFPLKLPRFGQRR